jgi:hypothetical protein
VKVASGGVVVAGRSAASSARHRVARAREVRGGEGKRKREKVKKGKRETGGKKEGRGCVGGIHGDGRERGVEHGAWRAQRNKERTAVNLDVRRRNVKNVLGG